MERFLSTFGSLVSAAVWPPTWFLAAVVAVFPGDLMYMGGAGLGMFLLDTISGVAAAWRRGEHISSRAFAACLGKFLGYTILLIASFVTDMLVSQDWRPPVPMVACRNVALVLIIVTETLSNLENAVALGAKVPRVLRQLLRRQLGDALEGAEEGKA